MQTQRQEQTDSGVVEQVKDFYVRQVREREARGAELPVVDLGSRSDFSKSEADQVNMERCIYSTEATSRLIRKARSRSFSIPAPWK